MLAILLKLALGGLNIVKIVGAALKRFFSALNVQGWIGLVGCAALAFVALHQWGEARHWKKQSDQFEKLYNDEKTAFDTTVAHYRDAAEQAKKEDAANAARVVSEQTKISEGSAHDYEARIADARATAERLRQQLATAANSGAGGNASVPNLSPPGSGTPQTSGQDGLSDALTATEQAIQLDELIKWVRKQAAVNPNAADPKAPGVDR